MDYNPSDKNQIFSRFSYVDDPQFIPSIFGGIADGGGFQQETQTAASEQAVVAYTHVFTPSTINVARIGFNHLHTTRTGTVQRREWYPGSVWHPGHLTGQFEWRSPRHQYLWSEQSWNQRLPAFR